MKKLAQDGKCWDTAEKEFKLPKYEGWPSYASGLPFVARRYCGLWGARNVNCPAPTST